MAERTKPPFAAKHSNVFTGALPRIPRGRAICVRMVDQAALVAPTVRVNLHKREANSPRST